MDFIQDYIFKIANGRLFANKYYEVNRTMQDFRRDYISSIKAPLDCAYILGTIAKL